MFNTLHIKILKAISYEHIIMATLLTLISPLILKVSFKVNSIRQLARQLIVSGQWSTNDMERNPMNSTHMRELRL
jgi:hypothetical protein